MNGAKDIRSYGYKVGSIPCGKANLITDVPGVKVGHCTVEENGHKTGVTAVIPCDGNVFVKKTGCQCVYIKWIREDSRNDSN